MAVRTRLPRDAWVFSIGQVLDHRGVLLLLDRHEEVCREPGAVSHGDSNVLEHPHVLVRRATARGPDTAHARPSSNAVVVETDARATRSVREADPWNETRSDKNRG